MQFSTILTTITLAMAVSAIPTEKNGGGSGSVPTCSTSAANKCCNGFSQQTIGGILSTIGLGCTNILGSSCTSGSAACCSTQQNGLVNVDVCQLAL